MYKINQMILFLILGPVAQNMHEPCLFDVNDKDFTTDSEKLVFSGYVHNDLHTK